MDFRFYARFLRCSSVDTRSRVSQRSLPNFAQILHEGGGVHWCVTVLVSAFKCQSQFVQGVSVTQAVLSQLVLSSGGCHAEECGSGYSFNTLHVQC